MEVTEKRINLNGDYLLVAPKSQKDKFIPGYHHQLSERAFLVDNISNFLSNYPGTEVHQITIYELREINEEDK